MRAGRALLAWAAALAVAGAAWTQQFEWQLPAGFPEPFVPADDPMSAAKVALGRELFGDVRLSVTGKHSCLSCHDPARAFTDGRAVSRGALGELLPVNAPTLVNAVYNASQGWRDPGIRNFEQQMHGPMFNEHPAELGLKGREADIERLLRDDPIRAQAFAHAFPGEASPVSMTNVIRAVAAYERTLIRGDSPFDRYVFGGDARAISVQQKRGMELFFSSRTGCSACHGGINFAGAWVDHQHPEGEPVFADTGTGRTVRVPTLRNLGATGPYLHDGSLDSVEAVLDHYEQQSTNPVADARLRRAPLTTGDRNALRDFLRTLDSY